MSTIISQRHWVPPDQLKIERKPGWAPKYVRKQDVARRLQEGWDIVPDPLKLTNEGGPVDRAQHYRGLILMQMPQHMADERNAYYRNLHLRRLRATARGGGMVSTTKAATHDNKDSNELAGTFGKGLQVRQGVVTEEGLHHSDNINIPVAAHPDDLREDKAELEKAEQERKQAEAETKPPAPTQTKPQRR